ncbi:MAG: VWA domain-containing protein [Acidobacteriaceae bacterium]|jgi:VWFA-related protein
MLTLPLRTRSRVSATLAAAVCLALAPSPAPAPAATRKAEYARFQSSAQPQFTIQTRVPLTIVDVTMADAKGNPVHGLQQSDFTILEDNKEMKPNSFEEHRSDEAAPTPTPVKQDLSPNTFSNLAPSPPKAGPLNILLLDSLNTPAQAQLQVIQRMLDFVNKMKPGTQVAVFRLTTHLAIVQGFTSDRELLKSALTSKSNFAASSLYADEAESLAARAEDSISAMRQIARYLSGMPGRKNLIWLSGLFPLAWPDPIYGVSPSYDVTDEMKSANDQLARAHVAINSIDSRGLQVDNNRNRMLKAEQYNMQFMADQTGGRAIYTSNDFVGSVEQAIDNGSNYYTITYTPTNQALDTRFRTISVKVDQPGLHLVYRNGYYAVDPTTDARGNKIETVSPMQTAMMRGSLDATQILFKVKAVQAAATEVSLPIHNVPDPKQMKPPYRHYSITYTIDIANIQFTPAPDGNYHAAFEYGIRVYNADGDEIVNSASKEAHPVLTPAAYQSMLKTGAVSHDEIDIPAKGDYFLRIAVHDLTTDRVGAIEIPTSSIHPNPTPAVASTP